MPLEQAQKTSGDAIRGCGLIASRRVILFFKARQFKNQPGYVLQNQRWHTITPIDQPSGKSSTPALSPFQPDPAQAFRQSLDRVLASRQSVVAPLTVSAPSVVLTALGVPSNPIVISRDVVRKATNGIKHNVMLETVRQLPEILADPVMVFDSATIPGGKVILTGAVDRDRQPVVIALHISVSGKHHTVHKIASLHGRHNQQIMNWIQQGLLRYRNTQKSLAWFQYRGLQLPKEGMAQGSPIKVLTEADIIKSASLAKAGAAATNISRYPKKYKRLRKMIIFLGEGHAAPNC